MQAAIVKCLYCFSTLELLDDFIRNLKIFNPNGILSLSHPFHSDPQIKTYHHSLFPTAGRPCSTRHSHRQLTPKMANAFCAHIRLYHLHHHYCYYSQYQSFSSVDLRSSYFSVTCSSDCPASLQSLSEASCHYSMDVFGC